MPPDESELREMENELARHHRDFEAISKACQAVRDSEMTAAEAVARIQNIVG